MLFYNNPTYLVLLQKLETHTVPIKFSVFHQNNKKSINLFRNKATNNFSSVYSEEYSIGCYHALTNMHVRQQIYMTNIYNQEVI